MIKVFKWWWAWDYEMIENWLEEMEGQGWTLIDTNLKGVFFNFERSKPAKARYCIDYQTKLTPEYIRIITDDGWKLYPVGMGWYILRKEYEDVRPDLYNDFDSLITRNKSLFAIVAACLLIEVAAFTELFTSASRGNLNVSIVYFFAALVFGFFGFVIVNLLMQLVKFRKRI